MIARAVAPIGWRGDLITGVRRQQRFRLACGVRCAIDAGESLRSETARCFYAARFHLDIARTLAFSFAHAGLAASWDIDDGYDPAYRLKCIEVLGPLDGAMSLGMFRSKL
jgi:hypothetical protein